LRARESFERTHLSFRVLLSPLSLRYRVCQLVSVDDEEKLSSINFEKVEPFELAFSVELTRREIVIEASSY
jgi:hypothetical protein